MSSTIDIAVWLKTQGLCTLLQLTSNFLCFYSYSSRCVIYNIVRIIQSNTPFIFDTL
jgi:hypothetical protein